MTSTEDPVDIHELSRRIGIDIVRLGKWLERGMIMEPHWRLERARNYTTKLWAWEELQHDRAIAEILGTADWSWVTDAIPPGIGRLWLGEVPNRAEMVIIRLWFNRRGKGHIEVPTADRGYLVLSEKRRHIDWKRVSYEEGRAAVEEQLSKIGDVRRAGSKLGPFVGVHWR